MSSTTATDTPDVSRAPEVPPAPPRKPRRRGLLIVGIIFLLFYFTPWMLSHPQVSDRVTRNVMPWLPEGSSLGDPTLGWMSPVQLTGINIVDDFGRPIFQCDHVTSEKTLWELVSSFRPSGKWTLENPKLTLRVNPTGYTLSPIVQRFLSQQKKGGRPLDVEILTRDGQIDFLDQQEQLIAQCSQVSVDYSHLKEDGKLKASSVLSDGSNQGRFELDAQWVVPLNKARVPQANITGQLAGLPMQVFEPWVRANLDLASLTGLTELRLDATIAPDADQTRSDIQGQLVITPHEATFRRSPSSDPEPLPTTTLKVNGQWGSQNDEVTLNQIALQAGEVTVDGHGTIRDARRSGVMDLRLKANQDLSPVLALLPPELRNEISIEGLRVHELAIVGAIHPELVAGQTPDSSPVLPVTAAAQVTWDTASLFGVEATPGAIATAWTPESLIMSPQQVRVGAGQLVSLPSVQLAQHKALVAEPGPILQDINITPEMCRRWLKFISPVLADATEVDGTMTVILDASRVPFAQPAQAVISGKLLITSATVKPGPLARQQIDAAASLVRIITQKNPPWADSDLKVNLPTQEIRFRMENGRVYHEGLTFQVGEISLSTRGDVGLDHSLNLMVDIPIPRKKSPAPGEATIVPQVVSIPIRGTLENPRVDGEAMAEIGRSLGAQAAGGLLQKLIDRAGDKRRNR